MSRIYPPLHASTLHLLTQVLQYLSSQVQQSYLVGGAVRNLLLAEPCRDWDIVIDGDAVTIARQLARLVGGHYAYLHEKASRVILKDGEQETHIDLAPMQGSSIEDDLRLRDFTVNAIALPLASGVASATGGDALSCIDPFHGTDDLAARCLRAVDDGVFRNDPLRMLRAVRFTALYHFTLEPQTLQLLARDATLLSQVASERIHEELYAILRPDGAAERVRFLDTHQLLTVLLPEFIPARGMPQPRLHHWDVLNHSIETVATLEQLATLFQEPSEQLQLSPLESPQGSGDLATIQTLLEEAEQAGLFQRASLRAPVTKMAALLHDIGKPVTYTVDEQGGIRFYGHPQAGAPLARQIMRRLGASNQDLRLVQQVVYHHMRPGLLSQETVTQRALRRYFVDLGPTGITVALISLADHLAMRGPEPLTEAWSRHLATVRVLLTRYIRERESLLPPRILQPAELMRRLHIAPGPQLGQLLEQIAEAQAEGRIHSKDEALWFAEEWLRTHSSDLP